MSQYARSVSVNTRLAKRPEYFPNSVVTLGIGLPDVGCASGYVAEALRGKGNYVVGVDLSEEAVSRAAKVLDEALVLDVESESWPSHFVEHKFDLILCAELIEHLFDPEAFLKGLRKILKPNGEILITTPNFLLWTNRVRIALGYYGLREVFFDRGHIRLFSHNGLMATLKEIGYQVTDESHLWYPPALEKLRKILPANLFVFQCILKVR